MESDALGGMSDAEVRQLIESTWPLNPLDDPRVKFWRAARGYALFGMLSYLALQYYFFDVYLTIMALPSAGVITAS
jgi:hypothetical protein